MAKIPATGKVSVEIRAAWITEHKPLGRCGHPMSARDFAILIPHDETKRRTHLMALLCSDCDRGFRRERLGLPSRREREQIQLQERLRQGIPESVWEEDFIRSSRQDRHTESLLEDARGRDSHQSEYVAQSTVLKTYEFTQGEIDLFLGAPDRLARNPHYRSGAEMRLYLRTRVEAVRNTETYLRSRMKRRNRPEYLDLARKLFTIQNSR